MEDFPFELLLKKKSGSEKPDLVDLQINMFAMLNDTLTRLRDNPESLFDDSISKEIEIAGLTKKFNAAAGNGYIAQRKKDYAERGLFDLSALHLKRAVTAEFNRIHGIEPASKREIIAPLNEEEAPEFFASMDAAQAALPGDTAELMALFETTTRIGASLADIDPKDAAKIYKPRLLREISFRGVLAALKQWRAKPENKPVLTRENVVGGYYRPWDNSITMWQKIRTPEDGAYRDIKNLTRIFLHETGHRIDQALGYPSQSREFIAAYNEDLKTIPAFLMNDIQAANSEIEVNVPEYMKYYLPGLLGRHLFKGVARGEVFAEMYPDKNGHGYEVLPKAFPRTEKIVDKALRSLAYEMSAKPPSLSDLQAMASPAPR